MATRNNVLLPDSDRFEDRFNAELDRYYQEQDLQAVRQLDQSINLGQGQAGGANAGAGQQAGVGDDGTTPVADLVRVNIDENLPVFDWATRQPSSTLEKILVEQQAANYFYAKDKNSPEGKRCAKWLEKARITEIAKALADQERISIARFHESQFEHDKPDMQTAEFIPAPYVDPDKARPMQGKAKKAFAGLIQNQSFDGNPNNMHNSPLYALLMTSSSFITEHSLSELDSYQLMRSFLKGSALELLQANLGSGVPFRSFWQTLQCLSGQTMNVETARQKIESLLITPPKSLAKVFSEITRYHAVLVHDMPKKERRLHRQVNLRKSVEELIERHFPWALDQILVKENSVKKSWLAERESLRFKNKPMTQQTVIYDVVNTLIGLAIQTCGNKDPVTADSSGKDKVKVNSHPPRGTVAEVAPAPVVVGRSGYAPAGQVGGGDRQHYAQVAEMQPQVEQGYYQDVSVHQPYADVHAHVQGYDEHWGYANERDPVQVQEQAVGHEAQSVPQEEQIELPEGLSDHQEAVLVEALATVGFSKPRTPGPRVLTRSHASRFPTGSYARPGFRPQSAPPGFAQIRPRFGGGYGPRPYAPQRPFQQQYQQRYQAGWQAGPQAQYQQGQGAGALAIEHEQRRYCKRCTRNDHFTEKCHRYSPQHECETKCPTCGGLHALDRGPKEPSCISRMPLRDVYKMRGIELPPELAERLKSE